MNKQKPPKAIEEWRDIPDYEGMYQVSDLGRVKSLARTNKRGAPVQERILTPGFNKRWGRLQVGLSKNGKSRTWKIHTLVARAFLGEQLKVMDVNHIDGNKLNNRLDNLEYCTRSENQLHAVRLGLNPHKHETHPMAKLTAENVAEIRYLSSEGISGVELARIYGVRTSQISRIKNGRRWQ